MSENTNYSVNTDDILDETEDGSKYTDGTVLAGLESALKEDTRLDPIHARIPARKSVRIILDPNIDGEAFQRWQKAAIIGRKKGPDAQIDSLKLSAIVIANCTIGLEVLSEKDNEYHEALVDGKPVTFRGDALKKMLVGDNPISSTSQLVRKLFGNDGHLLECSTDLVVRAGYGGEDLGDEIGVDADPTELS